MNYGSYRGAWKESSFFWFGKGKIMPHNEEVALRTFN